MAQNVYKINNIQDIFESDLPNLQLFLNRLNEIRKEEKEVIKGKNIDLLIGDVKSYVHKLSQKNVDSGPDSY